MEVCRNGLAGPHMGVWMEGITDPRCNASCAILWDGEFKFGYALNVTCMKCKPCKYSTGSLTTPETLMVETTAVETEESVENSITEEELREVICDVVLDQTKDMANEVWKFVRSKNIIEQPLEVR